MLSACRSAIHLSPLLYFALLLLGPDSFPPVLRLYCSLLLLDPDNFQPVPLLYFALLLLGPSNFQPVLRLPYPLQAYRFHGSFPASALSIFYTSKVQSRLRPISRQIPAPEPLAQHPFQASIRLRKREISP